MSTINVTNLKHASSGSNNIVLDSSGNATVAGTLANTGNLTITSGNLVLSSGNGINFAANSNATGMTSELLDDYEKGTWTPAIEGSTTAGTASYAFNGGRYTKVGSTVYIQAYISWSSGTGTGSLLVTGLPFTSENSTTNIAAMSLSNMDINGTAGNIFMADITGNTSRIRFLQYPTGGGTGTGVNYDAAGNVAITGMYFV